VLPRLEGGVVDLSEGVAGCWEALLDDFDIAMASLIAEIHVSASSGELQMISIDLPGTLSKNPHCSACDFDRFGKLGIARMSAWLEKGSLFMPGSIPGLLTLPFEAW